MSNSNKRSEKVDNVVRRIYHLWIDQDKPIPEEVFRACAVLRAYYSPPSAAVRDAQTTLKLSTSKVGLPEDDA